MPCTIPRRRMERWGASDNLRKCRCLVQSQDAGWSAGRASDNLRKCRCLVQSQDAGWSAGRRSQDGVSARGARKVITMARETAAVARSAASAAGVVHAFKTRPATPQAEFLAGAAEASGREGDPRTAAISAREGKGDGRLVKEHQNDRCRKDSRCGGGGGGDGWNNGSKRKQSRTWEVSREPERSRTRTSE